MKDFNIKKVSFYRDIPIKLIKNLSGFFATVITENVTK